MLKVGFRPPSSDHFRFLLLLLPSRGKTASLKSSLKEHNWDWDTIVFKIQFPTKVSIYHYFPPSYSKDFKAISYDNLFTVIDWSTVHFFKVYLFSKAFSWFKTLNSGDNCLILPISWLMMNGPFEHIVLDGKTQIYRKSRAKPLFGFRLCNMIVLIEN